MLTTLVKKSVHLQLLQAFTSDYASRFYPPAHLLPSFPRPHDYLNLPTFALWNIHTFTQVFSLQEENSILTFSTAAPAFPTTAHHFTILPVTQDLQSIIIIRPFLIILLFF